MGLHALIHQREHEVSIALAGEFRDPEYDQLAAIVKHFRNRGCRQFVLDLRGVARMNAATEASLRRLVERTPSRASDRKNRISAIRLTADNPAVRPQTDCGDLLFAS
jgi:anti-anti-sigma regulatory factor